jgi:FkbM family methyltransferase
MSNSRIQILVESIKKIKNWEIPMIYYFGLKQSKKIVNFKNGIQCIIRNKFDAIALYENFFMKTNCPSDLMSIKKNDIIIDIGAHVGYFTLYASNIAKEGKIYAFEPTNQTYQILKENIKLNKLKNVKTTNCGVLDQVGTATLYSDEENSISNSMFKSNNKKIEKINVINITKIIEDNDINKINLLKLDCEGAEFLILMELSNVEIKKIEKISVEVHLDLSERKIEDLENFLKEKGFKVITRPTKLKNLVMLYAFNQKFNLRN